MVSRRIYSARDATPSCLRCGPATPQRSAVHAARRTGPHRHPSHPASVPDQPRHQCHGVRRMRLTPVRACARHNETFCLVAAISRAYPWCGVRRVRLTLSLAPRTRLRRFKLPIPSQLVAVKALRRGRCRLSLRAPSPQVIQWPLVTFSPRMPAMISRMQPILATVAGSLKMTMPSAAAPIAPIPVQTA